ncbi:MAG: hypothetical protein R2824_35915 [Saprospiraceae bacterium]
MCVILLCSSCATLFNPRTERIDIITTEPARIVVFQDTFHQIDQRARLQVPRSMQPLRVEVITDSVSNDFFIGSKNSFAYWINIYFNYGLGMLIDSDSPKRYSYPSLVYIDPLQANGQYHLIDPDGHLNQWHARLYLPYLNFFHLQPDREPDSKSLAGFWGIAAGLDFYHQPNQFAELILSAESGFSFPFPAPVDFSGEYQVADSWHISLSNLHQSGRFSLGYGLSYSRNTWRFMFSDRFDPPPPTREPAVVTTDALGLNLPVYYQTGRHFYFSFLYRPSFLRFSDSQPNAYEHLISLGFGWDIYLRPPR